MANMWFGNRNKMQWIPCPSIESPMGREGYISKTNLLNGGVHIRRSLVAAKSHDLSWGLNTRDALRPIPDYYDGVYGEGAIYWSHPFAMDKNVLPQSVATPWLAARDAVPLNGSLVRPTLLSTPANTLNYPVHSALYTLNSGTDSPILTWIPIPPGYTAHIGAHGSNGTGGQVRARVTTGASSYGTDTTLTLLAVTSTTRFNHTVSSAAGDGVEIRLAGTGTVTLSGIMVQVLPTGATPATGGFISGQGHSGCDWQEAPVERQYSAALDKVGMTARLVEVQQWR